MVFLYPCALLLRSISLIGCFSLLDSLTSISFLTGHSQWRHSRPARLREVQCRSRLLQRCHFHALHKDVRKSLTQAVNRHFTGDESFLDDPNGYGYDAANYATESRTKTENNTNRIKDSRL